MQETLRNQTLVNNQYSRATGWLTKIESWDVNEDMIQQTRYAFDKAGNMRVTVHSDTFFCKFFARANLV